MTLADIYRSEQRHSNQCRLSFELYPPKTVQGEENLFKHVAELMAFQPRLITCTYGAGGSTRDKTLDIVTRVRRQFGCPVASHLTCVGSTRDDLRRYLSEAAERGIENIVALRGDPPQGEECFQATEGGLTHANELVTLIRNEFPQFGIAVAGYPETHQEAASAEIDLENLRRKVDCGADIVITQLFYDNEVFFRFRDRCVSAGIGVPIVPGLLPVTNLAQVQRITSLCGAKLPQPFVEALSAQVDSAQGDSSAGQFDVGVDFASEQSQQLIDEGVSGIHYYVLNKSQATASVLRNLRWDR